MSWTIAITAAISVASMAVGMVQQKQQAAYAEAAAEAEAEQLRMRARQARLDALQEEVKRMRQARWLSAANVNQEGEGIGFSETFRAVDKFNKRLAGDDITNIRLLGKTKTASLTLAAEAKELEADYYAKARKFTVFDAVGLAGAAGGADRQVGAARRRWRRRQRCADHLFTP